jgi:hypothetical protein
VSDVIIVTAISDNVMIVKQYLVQKCMDIFNYIAVKQVTTRIAYYLN